MIKRCTSHRLDDFAHLQYFAQGFREKSTLLVDASVIGTTRKKSYT